MPTMDFYVKRVARLERALKDTRGDLSLLVAENKLGKSRTAKRMSKRLKTICSDMF